MGTCHLFNEHWRESELIFQLPFLMWTLASIRFFFISRTVCLANFGFASLVSNYKHINFYNHIKIKLSMTQGKGSFRQSTIIKQNNCTSIIMTNVRHNLSLGTIISKNKTKTKKKKEKQHT